MNDSRYDYDSDSAGDTDSLPSPHLGPVSSSGVAVPNTEEFSLREPRSDQHDEVFDALSVAIQKRRRVSRACDECE